MRIEIGLVPLTISQVVCAWVSSTAGENNRDLRSFSFGWFSLKLPNFNPQLTQSNSFEQLSAVDHLSTVMSDHQLTISIVKADVPVYLQEGEFYRSLNDEGPLEALEVPANALKPTTCIENESDLVHLLTTLRFWVVAVPQVSVIDFLVQNGASEALRRVLADFIPQFPYLAVVMDHTAEPDNYKMLSLIDKAIHCGNCELMRALHARGDELTENSIRKAAATGNLECLKYVHTSGCKMNSSVFGAAALSGSVACVAYVHNHLPNCNVADGACRIVASEGQLQILKFFHENGYPWNESVVTVAARAGHLDCVRYACAMGCPLSSIAMESAVAEGHCDIVVYLHEQRCPYGAFALQLAVIHGHMDILKYLHGQGGVLDEECMRTAVEQERPDMLVYLHANGCLVTMSQLKQLARRDAVQCWKALYEHGVRWDESVADEAAEHRSAVCLRYMAEVDCPVGYAAVLLAKKQKYYEFLVDNGFA